MTKKESFYQQSKVINKIYKPNTATYLMLLLDKHKYWATHTEDFYKQTNRRFTGHFYISRTTFDKEINLKRSSQKGAEEELLSDGIIGLNPVIGNANWYTIHHDVLMKKIEKYNLETDTVKPVIDYPFDDSEEYKEWIFEEVEITDNKSTDPAVNNQQGGPSKSSGGGRQNATATNNKELTIKNNNKINNVTDVSNETDALNLDSSQDLKNSCIKIENMSPPCDSDLNEIQQIVDEYNSAMNLKQAKGDIESVEENIDDFRLIREYLTPAALKYVWEHIANDETRKKVTTYRLTALVKFKLLKPFVKRRNEIYTYFSAQLDEKLNSLFKSYRSQIQDIAESLNFTVNCFGELEPSGSNCEDYLTPKYIRKVRFDIYKNNLIALLPEDEKEDIIQDMENLTCSVLF
jgi:predicted metal-binding protein